MENDVNLSIGIGICEIEFGSKKDNLGRLNKKHRKRNFWRTTSSGCVCNSTKVWFVKLNVYVTQRRQLMATF